MKGSARPMRALAALMLCASLLAGRAGAASGQPCGAAVSPAAAAAYGGEAPACRAAPPHRGAGEVRAGPAPNPQGSGAQSRPAAFFARRCPNTKGDFI